MLVDKESLKMSQILCKLVSQFCICMYTKLAKCLNTIKYVQIIFVIKSKIFMINR